MLFFTTVSGLRELKVQIKSWKATKKQKKTDKNVLPVKCSSVRRSVWQQNSEPQIGVEMPLTLGFPIKMN